MSCMSLQPMPEHASERHQELQMILFAPFFRLFDMVTWCNGMFMRPLSMWSHSPGNLGLLGHPCNPSPAL